MRVLTVAPTPEGWVALSPHDCPDPDFGCDGCYALSRDPADTDVLGLVERCPRRMFYGYYCKTCKRISPTHGHLLTGFVKVVEVVPVEGSETPCSDRPHVYVSSDSSAYYHPSQIKTRRIDLPNAVPGGVAIRVEPCECPNSLCNGHGTLWRPEGPLSDPYDCPTCSDLPRPVTLHGDAPIQEVTP